MPTPTNPRKDKNFIIGKIATLSHRICCTEEACSYASAKIDMKKRTLKFAFLLPALVLSMAYSAAAQDSTDRSYDENARVDSLVNAYNQQEIDQDQKRKNSENLSDLKAEKRDTKAKAKEAQRIENEANNAARESNTAYRKEKKAQKSRVQADKQSEKAAKARSKSEKNKD
jgi:hypothetical protein